MLADKQNELMSDLLFAVHQHGGDDVTWKPPIHDRMKGDQPKLDYFLQAFRRYLSSVGLITSLGRTLSYLYKIYSLFKTN